MKVRRVASPSDFDSTLSSTLSAAQGRVFVVLFGTEVEATGESWCPDCVVSDPLIRKAILAVPDSTLLEVPVGDRATYRDPANFYRNHAELRVTSVPTLYEFGKEGKVIKKLVEREITADSLVVFIQ
ncbi:hypothetical protein BC830DRAFT_1105507 [Chytriomyces sp. MP71]|nr:hypothetical protein BC830DRAFT_1105507 [Chytriomyces sp. MP71]